MPLRASRFRLNNGGKREFIRDVPYGNFLPRHIHQTYRARPWPAQIEENVETLKRLNPLWQYNFYDDDDVATFIDEEYGREVLDSYLRIDPSYGAARADLFRYLLIYKCGGVYLDIKSTATRPLDAVLKPDDAYILAHWDYTSGSRHQTWGQHKELIQFGQKEFQQWHIAARAGHPFLKAVIEQVLSNIDNYVPVIHGNGTHATLRVTGPIPYTRAIYPLLHLHPHRIVDSDHDLGFRYTVLTTDARAHVNMLASHYSLLENPLVKVGVAQRLLFLPYRYAKRAYKYGRTARRR